MKAVWSATGAMIKNDGTMTNEQCFWNVFTGLVGKEARDLEPIFDHFYQNEFIDAKSATFTHPNAVKCIKELKSKGYRIVLATNPLFPRIATFTRIRWAGLLPEDFEWITTYENSSFSKPNLDYYREILKNLGKEPAECIMIGNDVKEDMCAAMLGMETYLLKDCLICSEQDDLTSYRQGNFDELLEMICALPDVVK
jgi:HAD superfamily hydrolase (TIGR01549 family)